MAEGAALLVDEVLPREPMRQWVLSVPFALRDDMAKLTRMTQQLQAALPAAPALATSQP